LYRGHAVCGLYEREELAAGAVKTTVAKFVESLSPAAVPEPINHPKPPTPPPEPRRTDQVSLEIVGTYSVERDEVIAYSHEEDLLGLAAKGPPEEPWEHESERPVLFGHSGSADFWFYRGNIVRASAQGALPGRGEVVRLNIQRHVLLEERSVPDLRREVDRLKNLADSELAPSRSREAIPSAVRNAVWRRDQGRCVECSSRENLEYDHVIPVSRGGANTERNLQLLCMQCNRRKGADI
jgi:hypothetical protein